MKKIAAVTLIGLLVLVQPACAIWFRSESLEWWTNVCDSVAIAEVTSIEEVALPDHATKGPSRETFRSQTITCAVSRIVKGKAERSFIFRQDYRRDERYRSSDDRPLRRKDKVLLFAVEKPVRPDQNVVFWVNLTVPDVIRSPHSAYNNDCKYLGDAGSILQTVESRIQKERQGAKTKARGLIVDFTAAPHDCHWEFVRTADPECKPGLVKQLQTSQYPDERELTMYNLISYPGHDTIKLLLPYLRDPTKKRLNDASDATGKPISTVEVFQLRQSAYLSLRLLGARPQKPEGFSPEWWSWHTGTGFESRTYFPYGDWERQEE